MTNREQAVQLSEEQGLSCEAIAKHVGVSPRSVRRYLAEHEAKVKEILLEDAVRKGVEKAREVVKWLSIDTGTMPDTDNPRRLLTWMFAVEDGVRTLLDRREADHVALRNANEAFIEIGKAKHLRTADELTRDATSIRDALAVLGPALQGDDWMPMPMSMSGDAMRMALYENVEWVRTDLETKHQELVERAEKISTLATDKELSESRIEELRRLYAEVFERNEDLRTTAGMICVELMKGVDGEEAAEHLEIRDDTLRKVADMAVERLNAFRAMNMHATTILEDRLGRLDQGRGLASLAKEAAMAITNANELREELMTERNEALDILRQMLGEAGADTSIDELGVAAAKVRSAIRMRTVQLSVAVYKTQTEIKGDGEVDRLANLVDSVQQEVWDLQARLKWNVLLWGSLGAVAGFLATVAAHDFGWLPL